MTNNQKTFEQWKAMGEDINSTNRNLINILRDKEYSNLITLEIRNILLQAMKLISKSKIGIEVHKLSMVKSPMPDDEKWISKLYPNIKIIDCSFDDYGNVVPISLEQCPEFNESPVSCVAESSLCQCCDDFVIDNDNVLVQCKG